MKDDIYANVAQKVSPITTNNNQLDKCRTLVEKLLQIIGQNFKNSLKKKNYLAEICQTEA